MNKKNIILSIALVIISVIYTILVKIIDVLPIGPNNSKVGFGTINNYFRNIIGSNMLIYKITEVLGILVILIALLYALKGLLQLIKRKSLLKVNSEILLVGSLYLVVILVYIFFEKFIINYRPILIDNELEASYPSSHTILALCICTSALMINKYLFSNKKFVKYYNAYIVVLLVGVLAGRILSGVHWLSDIVGGIIISITLLQIFRTVLWQIKNRIN